MRFAVALSVFLSFAATAGAAESPTPPKAQDMPVEKAYPEFGSRAPELKPSQWLQGEAVKAFEPGKLYLVACWSTLSTPAVKSIPILNDLHRRFAARGAVVVGVSVWEESATRVKDLIRQRGDALAFRVAFDGRDAGGTVARLWLDAGKFNGIPYLFAVRSGRVLWHGEPGELSAGEVVSMLDGTYDITKAAVAKAAEQEARLRAEPVTSRIEDLLTDGKWDAAIAKCDELEKILPGRDRSTVELLRAEALFSKGDFKTGYAATARYIEAHPNDPETLVMTALALISEPRFEGHRDFALPMRCVDMALSVAPIDPYRLLKARIAYSSGDHATADLILAALKKSDNAAVRAHLDQILPEIAARRPWPIPPTQDCACGAH